MSQKTKFVNYKDGGPESMFLDERDLVPAEGDVLIKVKALGINRAETLHRQGKYKINRPAEGFLGLEASG
jgi:NADPH:quinone reductase